MEYGDWNIIKEKVQKEDTKIFEKYNKSLLSDYKKRQIIFNFLCANLSYDYEKLADLIIFSLKLNEIDSNTPNLEEVILNKVGDNVNEELFCAINTKIQNRNFQKSRNLYKDLEKVIFEHKGICNGIAQYYKLLLEYNNIYSVCVICDNMMPRNHQINLVYDKDSSTYSFDDITTVITNGGTKEQCFDYSYEDAKDLNQGKRPVSYLIPNCSTKDIFNCFGVILPTEAINVLVGRRYDTSYLKYGLEVDHNIKLPENIKSLKKSKKRGI